MQPIHDWMSKPVRTLKPLDSIALARKVMLDDRVNQIVIVHGNSVVGIITDRDLRDAYPSAFEDARSQAAGAEDWSPDTVTVESVMTGDVQTLSESDTVAEAARLMRAERIGSVPILGDGGGVTGILTRSDVLDAYVALDADRES